MGEEKREVEKEGAKEVMLPHPLTDHESGFCSLGSKKITHGTSIVNATNTSHVRQTRKSERGGEEETLQENIIEIKT
jgi:hypothetical protein